MVETIQLALVHPLEQRDLGPAVKLRGNFISSFETSQASVGYTFYYISASFYRLHNMFGLKIAPALIQFGIQVPFIYDRMAVANRLAVIRSELDV